MQALLCLSDLVLENKEIQNAVCKPSETQVPVGEFKPCEQLIKLVIEKNELVLRLSALRLIEAIFFYLFWVADVLLVTVIRECRHSGSLCKQLSARDWWYSPLDLLNILIQKGFFDSEYLYEALIVSEDRKDPFKIWGVATIVSYFVFGCDEAKTVMSEVNESEGAAYLFLTTTLISRSRVISVVSDRLPINNSSQGSFKQSSYGRGFLPGHCLAFQIPKSCSIVFE